MTKVVIVGEMTLGESMAPGGPAQLPSFGRPEAPGQGLPTPPPGTPAHPIELPPGAPDQGLPPIPGQGWPPAGLHPGEIWPPLPPGAPTPSKAYAILAIPGLGYRYTVVELGKRPDQGLPGTGGGGLHPDHELPAHPAPEPKRK